MIDDINVKRLFRDVLNAMMELYQKPAMSKDVLRIWWSELHQYEWIDFCNAIDKFMDNQKKEQRKPVPMPKEIAALCVNRITTFAKIAAPLSVADNREHLERVKSFVEKTVKPRNSDLDWAYKILNNKKDYRDYSIKLANAAVKPEIDQNAE